MTADLDKLRDAPLSDIASACTAALQHGDLKFASELIEQAQQRWPDNARVHYLEGCVRLKEGRAKLSLFHHRKAVALDPSVSAYWQGFSDSISIASPPDVDPELVTQIDACLSKDRINTSGPELIAVNVLAKQFARIASQGVPLSPEILAEWQTTALGKSLYDLMLTLLANYRVKHAPLETAYAELRRELLRAIVRSGVTGTRPPLNLVAATAIQCFLNEYAFAESDWERQAIAALNKALRDNIVKPNDAGIIAIIAAYQPLGGHPMSRALRDRFGSIEDPTFRRMLRVQIDEPGEEERLKSTFAPLAPIRDTTSQQVQSQYEENPYPRWTRLAIAAPDEPNSTAASPHKTLVAGCGTGQNPLFEAAMAPAVKVTALDLSRASLAYAARKAREYAISNITFLHGDILDLPAIGQRFDFVVCCGVLHHMREPEKGLVALTKVTVPQGMLKLALYTESGRRAIVAGIELREKLGLPPTVEGIRRFRQAVYDLPAEHPVKSLTKFGDFYAVSECRDLVFHVQEHRYTLDQIAELLDRTGLTFRSMHVSDDAMAKFRQAFHTAEPTLARWAEFEQLYPGAFGSMYQFIATFDGGGSK